ncbi:urease accessory protein UreD [Paenibacillus doosanensis]|uniref:urease accessory protein UreD n=1 Tax=Paenibacillus doosanensis TaxID=1229154 RepID=UPI0021804D2A|nr:urease accessory protein UreD [Paenibacillus doosanensis]MCS7460864.1 urease accessory protein UreD [Paenibacillus doosanensis]
MDHWTGTLRLVTEQKRGRTLAKDVYYDGALKVTRPTYHDDTGQACYYIMNPGGGYLDGDRYRMDIVLEEHADLLLTTQAATKVYKTPSEPVIQETEIVLKAGSLLEYFPDPLIAYKDAEYKQKNVIRMEAGATYIGADILTPGWSPDGTAFSYRLLQLKTEIYINNRLAVFDHLRLVPGLQNLREIGYMEGFSHLGSMIAVMEQADIEFIDSLYLKIADKAEGCRIGLSQLPVPGFILRVFGTSTQKIERIFSECQTILRQQWLGKEAVFLRKY